MVEWLYESELFDIDIEANLPAMLLTFGCTLGLFCACLIFPAMEILGLSLLCAT